MNRNMALVGLLCCLCACDRQTPSAPTPTPPPTSPGPGSPNRAPEIVATFTPTSGIDQLTTFTARIDVRDPDNDRVALTVWAPCRSLNDTPLVLNDGVAVLSFVSDWKCSGFMFTAIDARGASTRVFPEPDHRGLDGPFRIVLGEDFYSRPVFFTTLTQSRTAVTGTVHGERSGTIDPGDPGTIDEDFACASSFNRTTTSSSRGG